MLMTEAKARRRIDRRLAALSEAHRRGIERFRRKLQNFVARELLSVSQSAIVEEHLLRLGERNRNPANTGNLEDLFSYTVEDTKDPVRAYAQILADSVKVMPMDDEAALVPALRTLDGSKVFRKVGDLTTYAPGERMLISHTMVAYGDPEMLESAAEFVRATYPGIEPSAVRRAVARMTVQSQHAPSSTFVLARMRGLTIDLADLYREAGYSEQQIHDAQSFYDVCGHFEPEWVKPFLIGNIPETPQWLEWRASYLAKRELLPEELLYQLSSDTLTNFFYGTLESGKWTDASVFFGGVSDFHAIPGAIAQIVNQYVAEHVALHDRPAAELTNAVADPLEPWGIGFTAGRAHALPGEPKKIEEIRAQFDAAWARKMRTK